MLSVQEMVCLSERINELCNTHYTDLPAKGKPAAAQWTVMSAVVMETMGELSVVAMATGTKCIGERNKSMFTVSDSHAEVLVWRLFRLFLLGEMSGGGCLVRDGDTFTLKPDILFHFYTSSVMCGDATIQVQHSQCDGDISNLETPTGSKQRNTNLKRPPSPAGSPSNPPGSPSNPPGPPSSPPGPPSNPPGPPSSPPGPPSNPPGPPSSTPGSPSNPPGPPSIPPGSPSNPPGTPSNPPGPPPSPPGTPSNPPGPPSNPPYTPSKHVKYDVSTRSGGKCLISDEIGSDSLLARSWHVTSVLRTKPGRGPVSLSLSCSDKLMKRQSLGLQGGLLSDLLPQPVRFKSINIGGKFSMESVKRAVFGRLANEFVFEADIIGVRDLFPSSLKNCYYNSKKECTNASNTSLIWSKQGVSFSQQWAAVNGRLQGATKSSVQEKVMLPVCRANMLRLVKSVTNTLFQDKESCKIHGEETDAIKEYESFKQLSSYKDKKKYFCANFTGWDRKNHIKSSNLMKL